MHRATGDTPRLSPRPADPDLLAYLQGAHDQSLAALLDARDFLAVHPNLPEGISSVEVDLDGEVTYTWSLDFTADDLAQFRLAITRALNQAAVVVLLWVVDAYSDTVWEAAKVGWRGRTFHLVVFH